MAIDIAKRNGKPLSVFALVMINVIAVDSLRSLPISAEYGLALVLFYLLGAVCFFIPTCLVTAELATTWPKTGGLYIWVREAFGKRWGLLAIWLQWVYNIVWYPTILAFLSATLSYLIDPHLAEDKTYTLVAIMIIFWGATIVNCFGIRASSWLSAAGAILGTLLPMIFIITLGGLWLMSHHASATPISVSALFPSGHTAHNIGFFIAILFGLLGIEMSAVHAGDVKNPQRDYPRALLISAIVILVSLVLASLAIAVVLPREQISLVSGLIQAYSAFFSVFHLEWMTPVIVILIVFGGMSCVGAWLIGPARGLMVASLDGYLPQAFCVCNRYGAPQRILLTQGVIFTVLCTVFLLMPSVSSSYWVLSALTAQLALIVYVLFFAAGLRLRYKKKQENGAEQIDSQTKKEKVYRIPCKNIGIWFVCILGILTCISAILIGFLPPDELQINNLFLYEAILCVGLIMFCGIPWLFRYKG